MIAEPIERRVVRHRLLPKQDRAMFATERHVLYSGAVGAGKSRLLCLDALNHCAGRPEARYGLFRKTRSALVKSTIKTLLIGDGFEPPVLPYGTYRHNKQDSEIQLDDGGLIIYTGVETPESVGSMNLTRAGVDEATEMNEDDYNAIDDRVRVYIGLPLQIISASNPKTPGHWMAKMMGISPDKRTPDPGCLAIMTRTPDNTYLPQDYIDGFERHRGTLYYRRMFLGEWCGSEGLIYEKWDRAIHCKRFSGNVKRVYLGVDDGTKNDPFVVLRIAEDDAGRLWITDEYFGKGMVQDEKIDTIRRMSAGVYQIIVDNAAPDLIETMRRKDMPAIPCEKGPGSVNFGITAVQGDLVGDKDGPRLFVDPDCIDTIREFETYEWKPRPKGGSRGKDDKFQDEPYDANNHAMDALRYVRKHLHGHMGAAVVLPDIPREVDDEHTWTRWN